MTGGMSGPGPHERMRPGGRRNKQGIRIDPEVEAEPPVRQAVLSALVSHEPGVLAEIAGLFSRRQFNIESLTVGPTVDEHVARMTIVVEESEPGVDQAKKQLEKLVPVISVRELETDAIERELALVKVNGDQPDKVQAVTEMYDGRTLDAGPRTITVELTGDEAEIDNALDAYKQFGIREIMRTGYAALARGEAPTAPEDAVVADGGRPGYFGDAVPAKDRTNDAVPAKDRTNDAVPAKDRTNDAVPAKDRTGDAAQENGCADDASAEGKADTHAGTNVGTDRRGKEGHD